jgi:predicted ATP-dependent endonuclease of OLD family
MLLLALNKQIRSSEVLFIEEIEQNLEPAMQRKIIKKLTSETNKQLFITTHSTDILKIFKLEDIFYFNKNGIKLLPQIDSNIDKYYRRAAEYRVLSSLFSKAVLLVEGDAELGGVPIISKSYGDFLDDNYISLISCQGKENIIRFAKFFDYLSIKNIAIYDNDTDIDETLSEYKNSKLNTLVLVVTRDYENGIVKVPLFKTHWKEILTSKHEFETNKYINNLFIERKASDKLKLILAGKEKAIKGIKSIEEIDGVLSDTELTEYLHDFLHRHMASISGSEYVMEYLYDLAQDKLEKVVPKDYVNIFKLISIYMGNNACSKNCILKPNTENICTDCADYRSGYLECFQIKE